MVTTRTRAEAHPQVLFTELQNGDAVLLHLGAKTYYSLNDTGAHIWRRLAKGLTVAEVGQDLTNEFDITLERAQEFVVKLANELEAAALIQLTDS